MSAESNVKAYNIALRMTVADELKFMRLVGIGKENYADYKPNWRPK